MARIRVHILVVLCTSLPIAGAQTNSSDLPVLEDICGDCWCVPDSSTGCPAQPVGISANFPTFVSDIYASFEATNTIPLQDSSGSSSCYPFQDTVTLTNGYAQSLFPQCEIPTSQDGVCAFVFEDNMTFFSNPSQCTGRKYSMVTYSTVEEIPVNGALTHNGTCGVCSSAQDLAVRMVTRDTLQSESLKCGTRYFFANANDNPFQVLLSCFLDLGFTQNCATLWSHYTATNAVLCTAPCLGSAPPYNGPPPECTLDECIQCSAQLNAVFDTLAGRTQTNSGITETIGRNCSEFYPVVHDPCPGQTAAPTPAPVTNPPAMASAPTSATTKYQMSATVIMSLVWMTLQMYR